MDNISSQVINIIILIIVIFIIYQFIINFLNILYFKWYIDYFDIIENMCNKNKRSLKYEIETYRYNLYNFLYSVNDNNFNKIKIDYYNSFNLLIIMFSLFIICLVTYNIVVPNDIDFIMKISMYITVVILLILFSVGGLLNLKNYETISGMISDKNNDLYTYAVVYKILNAIFYISDFRKDVFNYYNDKIDNDLIFDDILEKNISSTDDLVNIANIKFIKSRDYENLDFLKYISMDKTSPYYFNYFENIYIKLPNQEDLEDKVYIEKIYKNKLIDENWKENNDIYNNINSKINEIINKKTTLFNVEDDDYIKFLINNKDIILNPYMEKKYFNNIITNIHSYSNYIYFYVVFIIIVCMIVLHYLFNYINNITYSFILFGLILIFIYVSCMNNYYSQANKNI